MLELKKIGWTLPTGETIIQEIDLTVSAGQLTVVTGPNGGGKTSLAKLIAGLRQPTKGHIYLDGVDITDWDITKRAQNGIGYAFQQPVHFKGLKVRELLEIAAGQALSEKTICRLLAEVGLCAHEYIDRDVDGSLSGGECKRIEIASVLARRNMKLIVFDEPEAGIDLWSFTSLISAFERLKKEHGEALLVISHQERILDIADQIVVVADGRVRMAGSREEVLPTLWQDEKQSFCPLEAKGHKEVGA